MRPATSAPASAGDGENRGKSFNQTMGSGDWAKEGLLRGALRTLREPSDLGLALRIGLFVVTLPGRLARRPLPEVLGGFGGGGRVRSADVYISTARISRLRQAWLASPFLASRDTCYVRAITLYRFLDPVGHDMRIHFGVEPGIDPQDRLRGHAWVSLDGALLEPPEPVVAGRVREIYAYPDDDS